MRRFFLTATYYLLYPHFRVCQFGHRLFGFGRCEVCDDLESDLLSMLKRNEENHPCQESRPDSPWSSP